VLESCLSLDEALSEKSDGLAAPDIHGKESPLANVDVSKPEIGKGRKRQSGGLWRRIGLAHDSPPKLGSGNPSVLMSRKETVRQL